MVRATGEITTADAGDGWTQLGVRIDLACEGAARPACVADVLLRFYPIAED
jgi:hypothetical protein